MKRSWKSSGALTGLSLLMVCLAVARAGDPADSAVEFCGIKDQSPSVAFVVDASGLMLKKFDALRPELRKAIRSLRPPQKFNVVFFHDTFAITIGNSLIMATLDNLQKADDFLAATVPQDESDRTPGLTKAPLPGFIKAFSMKPELIYFLAGGDFPDHDGVAAEVRRLNADKHCRINTIALVDRGEAYEKFLRQLAADNGGTFRYVSEEELNKSREKREEK